MSPLAEPLPEGIPERFAVERRMGAGAFGTVLVVWDREREQRVALKRLARADSASIYRFKQEFRALADLSHPNLVRLHELFALGDGWCFTMELVEGVHFDTWVRGLARDPGTRSHLGSTLSGDTPLPGGAARAEEAPATHTESRSAESTQVAPPASTPLPFRVPTTPPDAPRQAVPLDEARLRAALRELGSGVLALHAAGILHRDLKPSNVLVRADGRLVILDFGLAATGVVDSFQSLDGGLTGTPAYMSPEQARGAPLTPASDWYAVGVMLYEALCGELPFGGTVGDMLAARQLHEPRDVRTLRPDLPADLCELCMELLRRDPAARPKPGDIARRLGLPPPTATAKAAGPTGAFVGRRRELEALHQGFLETRKGTTVVAHVHGPSGYGKSTLVRQFLSGLALHENVVVLEGRCYERESVPFKALDQLVDGLGAYLRRLQPVEAAGLLPRDARALVRLFPALGRLDIMTNLPGRAPSADVQELRRRAFSALRETFARITDTRGLVLFIDDVHWGDADSASLVRHLLAPPEVPPLLLVVGYRGDSTDGNDLLRVLRTPRASDAAWNTVDVQLGPLPEPEAVELAAELLGDPALASAHADKIARESGGSPLFVAELVRAAIAGRGTGHELSLPRVLGARITALPDDARLVLEYLCASGRKLSEAELRAASGLDPAALSGALDRLRDEHLIVVSGEPVLFEPLHDKVRVAMRDCVTAEALEARHGRLAETFEQAGSADPETLAYHYGAARRADKALVFTERAADRASEALAFDHAVDLYRSALALAVEADAACRVRRKLANVLSSAGRGAEAAVEYLALAETDDAAAARTWRRSAAEAFIRSGHVVEAMQVFGRVLEAEGLAPPSTPGRALTALIWNRSRLRLRGMGFKARAAADVDPADLRRIDACWVLGGGLAGIDLVRSAHYHTSALMMALDTGEPYRVARSLAISAILKALESEKGVGRARELATRAKEIATSIGKNNHALGLAIGAEGVIAWGESNFSLCVEKVDEAIPLLRERGGESFREVGSLEIWFALHSLFLKGELRQVAERGPACVREAEARGDRYTTSTARAYTMPFLWAIRDRTDEARREADAATAVWPEDAWYHQHWAHLRAHCFLDLYEGRGEALVERLLPARRRMKKSMQLRLRTLRIEFAFLEARAALERAHKDSAGRDACVGTVRKSLAAIAAERSLLGEAYARALEAGLTSLIGTEAETRAAYDTARTQFEALGMPLHVAATDIRRGELEGGDKGAALVAAAHEALTSRGIVAPAPFANMLVPRLLRR